MDKDIFKKLLKEIKAIRKEIKGLTFEQAGKRLGGYNYDGELFDYDWGIDDGLYLVGTVYNKKGKAFMDKDHSFYEVWDSHSGTFGEQILSMTESEVIEQLDRLK